MRSKLAPPVRVLKGEARASPRSPRQGRGGAETDGTLPDAKHRDAQTSLTKTVGVNSSMLPHNKSRRRYEEFFPAWPG